MKKTTIVITAIAMLIITAIAKAASAQTKNDLPEIEKQKQLIELSKTNKNHQLLLGLSGNWSFAGKHFPPDSSIEPIEFKGTATRKAIMDGRYFIVETLGEKLIMPWSDGKEVNYQDITIEGYDNEKRKFFSARAANHWGTGIVTAEGSYDSTTKTFTYELEIERAGERRKFQDRIKILGTDHYLFERFFKKGDQEIKISESNYTRSGK